LLLPDAGAAAGEAVLDGMTRWEATSNVVVLWWPDTNSRRLPPITPACMPGAWRVGSGRGALCGQQGSGTASKDGAPRTGGVLACFQEVGELVTAVLQNLHVNVCSDSAAAKALCSSKLECSERK
jgi:hypothetical protein